jgi:hypothetical protein
MADAKSSLCLKPAAGTFIGYLRMLKHIEDGHQIKFEHTSSHSVSLYYRQIQKVMRERERGTRVKKHLFSARKMKEKRTTTERLALDRGSRRSILAGDGSGLQHSMALSATKHQSHNITSRSTLQLHIVTAKHRPVRQSKSVPLECCPSRCIGTRPSRVWS